MKLVPCNEDDLKVVNPRTNLWKVLNEFVNGDFDVVEVRDFTNKDAKNCAASIGSAIRRYRFNVQVIKRGERVFLVRKK